METKERQTFETVGLFEKCGYEVSASVANSELGDECREFVHFVSDYLLKGNVIRAGETLAYGYWLTKAALDDQQRIFFGIQFRGN